MTARTFDLGSGVSVFFVGWHPDRDLNPQYADLPDEDRAGLVVCHTHDDGVKCRGMVTFDTPTNRRLAERSGQRRPLWTVESFDPLTISPSVLRRECGLHGFIRAGRWVPA